MQATTILLPFGASKGVASVYEVGTFLNDVTGNACDVIQIGLLAPIFIVTSCSARLALIGLLRNELGLLSDRVDLPKAALQLVKHNFDLNIFGLVVGKFILDAHPMESVLTGEDVEFFIENGLEAEVAHLARVNRDMLVLLLPLLLPQKLGILGMVLKLLLERVNLVVVIIQTLTEMFLHVLDLLIWREQGQEVVNLQLRVF